MLSSYSTCSRNLTKTPADSPEASSRCDRSHVHAAPASFARIIVTGAVSKMTSAACTFRDSCRPFSPHTVRSLRGSCRNHGAVISNAIDRAWRMHSSSEDSDGTFLLILLAIWPLQIHLDLTIQSFTGPFFTICLRRRSPRIAWPKATGLLVLFFFK